MGIYSKLKNFQISTNPLQLAVTTSPSHSSNRVSITCAKFALFTTSSLSPLLVDLTDVAMDLIISTIDSFQRFLSVSLEWWTRIPSTGVGASSGTVAAVSSTATANARTARAGTGGNWIEATVLIAQLRTSLRESRHAALKK